MHAPLPKYSLGHRPTSLFKQNARTKHLLVSLMLTTRILQNWTEVSPTVTSFVIQIPTITWYIS